MSEETKNQPAPEEGKSCVPYTAEQQEIIDGLVEAQTKLGVGDKEFATKYLRSYTQSTWSKLRSGDYGAKDYTKAFAELKSALISIRRRISRQAKATQGGKYYEFDQFKAMFRAVRDCLEKRGENRLIFYVAPTGGGKSRFFAELGIREETTVARANESWFSSYFFAAVDILKQLEISGRFGSTGYARRALIDAMQGRAQVLGIDEGNYFGPRSINLVKDILNETEWTVVIALTPESFDKMKRHYAEWSQLQRRIHTVFRFEPVTAAQGAEFVADAGLNGDSRQAGMVLAKAANEFGGFDFINRVIERLDEQVQGKKPHIEDVHASIAFVRKQLDLSK